jgi:hypothetical protein
MRYIISENFYKALSELYLIALESQNNLEIDLVFTLLKDVQKWQDGADLPC